MGVFLSAMYAVSNIQETCSSLKCHFSVLFFLPCAGVSGVVRGLPSKLLTGDGVRAADSRVLICYAAQPRRFMSSHICCALLTASVGEVTPSARGNGCFAFTA